MNCNIISYIFIPIKIKYWNNVSPQAAVPNFKSTELLGIIMVFNFVRLRSTSTSFIFLLSGFIYINISLLPNKVSLEQASLDYESNHHNRLHKFVGIAHSSAHSSAQPQVPDEIEDDTNDVFGDKPKHIDDFNLDRNDFDYPVNVGDEFNFNKDKTGGTINAKEDADDVKAPTTDDDTKILDDLFNTDTYNDMNEETTFRFNTDQDIKDNNLNNENKNEDDTKILDDLFDTDINGENTTVENTFNTNVDPNDDIFNTELNGEDRSVDTMFNTNVETTDDPFTDINDKNKPLNTIFNNRSKPLNTIFKNKPLNSIFKTNVETSDSAKATSNSADRLDALTSTVSDTDAKLIDEIHARIKENIAKLNRMEEDETELDKVEGNGKVDGPEDVLDNVEAVANNEAGLVGIEYDYYYYDSDDEEEDYGTCTEKIRDEDR